MSYPQPAPGRGSFPGSAPPSSDEAPGRSCRQAGKLCAARVLPVLPLTALGRAAVPCPRAGFAVLASTAALQCDHNSFSVTESLGSVSQNRGGFC